jgi:indole-3-glycerol phosphate synthase
VEEIKTINPSLFPNRTNPIYSLSEFLLKHRGSIIAECKKGSPSAGILKEDYDPVAIAEDYEKSGAKAISVLTDQKFFYGSLMDLQRVSNKVKLPTIRKDFIIDRLQILEAKHFGASAVLLIVRILSPEQLSDLYQYAYSLGLEVLVETHKQSEIDEALKMNAKIIGINTRDLDTFEIHKHLVEDIAPTIPESSIIVAESGIHTNEDYEKMKKISQSMLIGTYFMKQTNIQRAFLELVGSLSKE